MFAIAVMLAVLVGVSLGMLGGGGSILMVPILSYVVGMTAKEAITASLFVVAVTSTVGAAVHARAGRVRWRTGLVFGAAGMVGAFGGGALSALIPGRVLMILFALVMTATAIAMLRPRRIVEQCELASGRAIRHGLAVGALTGLVGAGGGFVVVPALCLLGGLPIEIAVGTSLLVIAMNAFAGLASHLGHVDLDWGVTLAVTAAAVVGSLAGGRIAGKLPAQMLRRGFGILVIVMAAFVLARELVG